MFKKRSMLGKWMDKRGISQTWLTKKTKLNKNTITNLCNDPNIEPKYKTVKAVLKALKEIDPTVTDKDIFKM